MLCILSIKAFGGDFIDNTNSDILQGIALEEAGIAHILNAEGEKIQLAVKNCSCISELLEINASVSCTVEQLMWLEFISYHKIKAILCGCGCLDECKDCDKKPCDKPDCKKKKPCCKPRECPPDDCVAISGRVFKANGDPARNGVVTASGDCTASTDICFDGQYTLKISKPTSKIVVNAHSECGKTGSFLLKAPFKDSYQIDMFLDG